MKVGGVTIGQSPRVDLTPDIGPLLPGVKIVERGALDGCSAADLERLSQTPNGHVLATRLRDGTQIVIGEEDVYPLMQKAITELEGSGVRLILVFCTGTLEPFNSSVPVLYPERILQTMTKAVISGQSVGILTPNEAQQVSQAKRWMTILETEVQVEIASLYTAGAIAEVAEAASRLAKGGAEVIVMDCLGYSLAMQASVKKTFRGPVLVARSALARVAAEVLGLQA